MVKNLIDLFFYRKLQREFELQQRGYWKQFLRFRKMMMWLCKFEGNEDDKTDI